MLVVSELTQTCGVSPSQWEGRTSDGRHIYVRYRWGVLRIGVGDTHIEAVDTAMDSRRAFIYRQLGDGFDGQLSMHELVAYTRHVIDWPVGELVH